jgi:DNA repair exonuclease SbcCD nuclease subunit
MMHKREERQQRLRDAFQQAVTFAIGQKADFFIQAGDLFDTSTPTERDRSFVAARLAQLKQAGVQVVALGGVHDTPVETQGEYVTPAPQVSYAQLGALHYLSPILKKDEEVEPLLLDAHGNLVGICGLGSVGLGEQTGDLLAQLRIQSDIERATLPILVLHAPIEGMDEPTTSTSRPMVSRASIEQQHTFRYILAGHNHTYQHQRIGQTEVIVAGATHSIQNTQQSLINEPHASVYEPASAHPNEPQPGFVFMGLATDGLRWCNHIVVEALRTKQLRIAVQELWADDADTTPTERILERLEPLCDAETTIQLRLEGEITRRQYHQLDLNMIRHYGEEHCFSLAIDDSNISLISDQDTALAETGERFSPREELIAVVEEWIADTHDEYEQKALRTTKEELLLAMDDSRGKRL